MESKKLLREQKTIEDMVDIFCTQIHKHKNGLCDECKTLLEYSELRLKKCSFGTRKPICSRCELHCYKQEMRNQVRLIMRYSGRRMLFAHPMRTIMHFMDSFK